MRVAGATRLPRNGIRSGVRNVSAAPARRQPMRLSLRTDASLGALDLIGSQYVRADPQLLGRLRALPGVSEVELQFNKPANGADAARSE